MDLFLVVVLNVIDDDFFRLAVIFQVEHRV